jgi:hypothetical protein
MHNTLPVCDCGQIASVANSRAWMVYDFGLTADNPRPLPMRVHGQLMPLPVREYGLFVNMIVGVDSPRMRTVRGHGQIASEAGIEPDHDPGHAAFAAMSDTYCEAVPHLHRDRFAAMRTCLPAGVGLALN